MESKKKILIEILTEEPMKQNIIVQKMHEKGINTAPRGLRKLIKSINNDFIKGQIDYVIISGRNGTYKSKNEKDIREFNRNKIKHAKSELWSAYNVNKRIEKNKNLSFIDYINDCMKGAENG